MREEIMQINIEISYYSLTDDFKTPVREFIEVLSRNDKFSITPGAMSTYVEGDFDELMNVLNNDMRNLMEKYPSVFCLKISNACQCREK